MNKKKEIDKLARLTILANFVSSKLKEQKDLVKSFINEEDKVLKGIDHKLNVITREYARFDSCLLYTSPSPRDLSTSRMPSSA